MFFVFKNYHHEAVDGLSYEPLVRSSSSYSLLNSIIEHFDQKSNIKLIKNKKEDICTSTVDLRKLNSIQTQTVSIQRKLDQCTQTECKVKRPSNLKEKSKGNLT